MASIGKKEEIARLKEFYQTRESEIEKKHKKAIDELRDQQHQDLTKVRENSTSEVDIAKSRMREKLSEMDQKHMKEIDSLREMYQRKLEQKS